MPTTGSDLGVNIYNKWCVVTEGEPLIKWLPIKAKEILHLNLDDFHPIAALIRSIRSNWGCPETYVIDFMKDTSSTIITIAVTKDEISCKVLSEGKMILLEMTTVPTCACEHAHDRWCPERIFSISSICKEGGGGGFTEKIFTGDDCMVPYHPLDTLYLLEKPDRLSITAYNRM